MSERLPLKGNAALHHQLENHPLSHAYLLSGLVGSGRHTAANWLAKAMVCSGENGRPCGVCLNCRKAAEHIHPDIIRVPDGGALSVEEARELRTDAYICPNEADRKVYVFENAGALSEKVQNVLLKLVEEGPEYAAFLFLTEHAAQLIPTIRSRCEELKFTPVSREELMEVLTARYPDKAPEELNRAAEQSGGMVGQALSLLDTQEDEDTAELDQLAEEFCAALGAKDELGLASFMAAQEKRSRQELSAICQGCRRRLHSALLLSAGVSGRVKGESTETLSRLSRGQLLSLSALMEEALQRLEGNAGSGHLLGWLAVSCANVISA